MCWEGWMGWGSFIERSDLLVGHDLTDENELTDQYCIPLGSQAVLDADNGTLRIDPIVC